VDILAILGGNAPGESYLWDPALFVRKTLEGTLFPVLRGTEVRASHPMTGPWASHPGSVTTVKAEEPQIKHKLNLLTDNGDCISAIPFSLGPRSSKKITV
jgi:hypothetical protein